MSCEHPLPSLAAPPGLEGVNRAVWGRQADPIAFPQACERDPQCGSGTCCAVSLWLRGLRMCTPLGQEGDECHPFSHKVPGGPEGGGPSTGWENELSA